MSVVSIVSVVPMVLVYGPRPEFHLSAPANSN